MLAISEVFEAINQCAIKVREILNNPTTQYLTSQNTSGDTQLKVDVQADKLIESILLSCPQVRGVCSEEKDEIIYSKYANAKLLIAYDPLDGSSILDSNFSVGSIFGIYENKLEGKSLIASAYIIYGTRLEIVRGDGTNGKISHLRLVDSSWLELETPILKEKGKISATGGTQANWSPKHQRFIRAIFEQGYRLRYSGGMVPDLHQILIKGGGLFSYPATSDAPHGKLRKLFEVFPLALIFELAGGEAIDGKRRLLELDCSSIHQSTPCFFGSKEEIKQLKLAYT